MARWTYTERLLTLLVTRPHAHSLFCWLLSHQQGGEVFVSLRQVAHELRNASLGPPTLHYAFQHLVAERFIETLPDRTGTLVRIVDPEQYGIMPLNETDRITPKGDSAYSRLQADVFTVLNYYRRVVRRGDNVHESSAMIRHWLEKGYTKEQLVAGVDAYEAECLMNQRPYRRVAHTFFDPLNGPVEGFIPEEAHGAVPKAGLRESTRKMRDVFAQKEEPSGDEDFETED